MAGVPASIQRSKEMENPVLNRTLVLAVAAVLAVVVGVALSFFELIVLGVVVAAISAFLYLRREPAHETARR